MPPHRRRPNIKTGVKTIIGKIQKVSGATVRIWERRRVQAPQLRESYPEEPPGSDVKNVVDARQKLVDRVAPHVGLEVAFTTNQAINEPRRSGLPRRLQPTRAQEAYNERIFLLNQ